MNNKKYQIRKGCFYRYGHENTETIYKAIGKKQLMEYQLNYEDGKYYQVYCAKPTKYDDIERYHLIKVDTRIDKIGD